MIGTKHHRRSLTAPTAFSEAITDAEFKQRTVFVVSIVVVAIVAVVAIWEARVILLVLFAGFLGALVLSTLTAFVQKWMRIPRAFAFTALLAGLGVAIALGAWLRGPELAQQFAQLQVDLPAAAGRLYVWIGESPWGHWAMDNAPESGQLSGWLIYAASGIRGAVSAVVSAVAFAVLVMMASIYLAAEPNFYRGWIRRFVPSSIWVKVNACLRAAIRTLRLWLVSRLVSMTVIGVLIAAGLWMLHVPLAGTLGIIAALLTFVPNIGPFVSALPAGLMAFSISPTKGLLSLGLFCLAHFIEGNFVTPLLDRQIVKLPPFITLSLQLLLAPLAGALGVAMAAPLLAATLGILTVLLPVQDRSDSSVEIAKQFDTVSEELDAASQSK